MDVWKPATIEPEECFHAQVGPLGLWFKRTQDELHIAVDRLSEEAKSETVPIARLAGPEPEGLDWGRWIIGSSQTVQLAPIMPDRPVVVRPEVPVKIPTDKEALFFVSIPVWIRVTAGSEQMALCEEPSVILSNIWFGDCLSGELCYSLRSRARRQITDSVPQPHRAVCPVQIRNAAPTQLDVERFCVHVEHLRIYSGENWLWTNRIDITFKGEEMVGQIAYAKSAPAFESVGTMLSEARTPLKETLLRKSLGGFKRLSGM
jgi:hypothetical protein